GRLGALAGARGAGPLRGAELERLAAEEQRVFDRLRGTLRVRRATTSELQWLVRRAACRGVAEPALDRHWEPDALVVRSDDGALHYEPLEHDLWRLANAPMTEPRRGEAMLRVEAEEGESWQALVCAGALAEE